MLILIATLAIGVTEASAYEVTVHNPTGYTVEMELYVYRIIGGNQLAETKTIYQGETGTFHTGALCPSGFTGHILDYNFGNSKISIYDTNCYGNKKDKLDFLACCWKLHFNVCRKTPFRDKPERLQYGDYAFCKD